MVGRSSRPCVRCVCVRLCVLCTCDAFVCDSIFVNVLFMAVSASVCVTCVEKRDLLCNRWVLRQVLSSRPGEQSRHLQEALQLRGPREARLSVASCCGRRPSTAGSSLPPAANRVRRHGAAELQDAVPGRWSKARCQEGRAPLSQQIRGSCAWWLHRGGDDLEGCETWWAVPSGLALEGHVSTACGTFVVVSVSVTSSRKGLSAHRADRDVEVGFVPFVWPLACEGWNGGFLVNLGACGSDAPGQGNAAGVVQRCSALANATSGDVVAKFVEESATAGARIGAVAGLELAACSRGERARVPACVETGCERCLRGARRCAVVGCGSVSRSRSLAVWDWRPGGLVFVSPTCACTRGCRWCEPRV